MTPMLGIMASQISGHLVTNSYESISTVTVSSNVSSVSFTSIPATYKHLQIRLIGRGTAVTIAGLRIQFNGDTSGSYASHRLDGTGAVAYASAYTPSQTFIANYGIAGGNLAANIFGANIIDILDYNSTTKYKTVRWLSGLDYNGGGAMAFYSGLYMNSANAISSIYMETDTQFVQYSSFALYGIKA